MFFGSVFPQSITLPVVQPSEYAPRRSKPRFNARNACSCCIGTTGVTDVTTDAEEDASDGTEGVDIGWQYLRVSARVCVCFEVTNVGVTLNSETFGDLPVSTSWSEDELFRWCVSYDRASAGLRSVASSLDVEELERLARGWYATEEGVGAQLALLQLVALLRQFVILHVSTSDDMPEEFRF